MQLGVDGVFVGSGAVGIEEQVFTSSSRDSKRRPALFGRCCNANL